jgi:hypothetical protein
MLHQNEDWKRDGLKVVEEMSELSTRIMQQVNKPNKDLHVKIAEEIADVTSRLKTFTSHYDSSILKK